MGGGCLTYPILYKANETDFSHMGLGVLKDAITAKITEERNGLFEMEIEYPTDGIFFNELKLDRLVKTNASPKLKDQRFKIIRITKPSNGRVTIFLEHVSYHTQDLQLKPKVIYNGTALTALNIWKNNIVDNHPFTVHSDIGTEASGMWTIDKVDSARRALGGVAGSLLDSYGGEYRFDNYHISLLTQRGFDSGVFIGYGKNLIDLTQEEEISNTYTSVYPYSVVSNEKNEEELITLPEYFVDSEHVDSYARRKILPVDFSQEKIVDVEKLRSHAKSYIKQNDIGVPKINLKVKFVDLAKTLDYADLQLVEEVGLCDWVNVYFEKLDINQRAKVIKVVWDSLMDRYEEIELGEARSTLSKSIKAVVDGRVELVESQLNIVQIAANGKNKVFRGKEEPTSGMIKNDLWYKPVGDGEIELYNFDGTIWRLEKVSAGLLGGTLDAENGDVNLINVNVANIVGETSNFVRSAWNGINSNADMDANRLRFTHTDGTSTEIGKNGFRRITPSDNRTYHYLFYATTFIFGESSSNARWIQLPNDYKGKQFEVFMAIADSMTAPSYSYSVQRFVCTVHPDHSIDYANARVPVISYKSSTLMDGSSPVIDEVQGLLFAIY